MKMGQMKVSRVSFSNFHHLGFCIVWGVLNPNIQVLMTLAKQTFKIVVVQQPLSIEVSASVNTILQNFEFHKDGLIYLKVNSAKVKCQGALYWLIVAAPNSDKNEAFVTHRGPKYERSIAAFNFKHLALVKNRFTSLPP